MCLSLTEGKNKSHRHILMETTLLSAMENPTAYMESHDKNDGRNAWRDRRIRERVATKADIESF